MARAFASHISVFFIFYFFLKRSRQPSNRSHGADNDGLVEGRGVPVGGGVELWNNSKIYETHVVYYKYKIFLLLLDYLLLLLYRVTTHISLYIYIFFSQIISIEI
jgi:hypothetical protein